MELIKMVFSTGGITVIVIAVGLLFVLAKCYRKVEQGYALIRNGMGGTKVSFSGMIVFPVIHHLEIMDISVKRIGIDRHGENGLICRDNMRADVQVAFFVRVNHTPQDVKLVAENLGCDRGSDPQGLVEFFDAKFSEGLKTVGKQFDFVDLYTNRQAFKEEILKVIGTDLNGYVLDDAAIDYLEQTPLSKLDANNILDADGIKKITDLTAKQAVLANNITRDKEKTIRRQDVEAREAILELDKQQADAEQRQQREIAEITAREQAQAMRVQQEERLKAERARITTEEEVAVAEENKNRQIIVAAKNKERTEKVETERVEKDRAMEAVERERVVTIADIEKEKAVEVEKKAIQDVIRERVAVERTVVEEQQKILDTESFATADRSKRVEVTKASEQADMAKVKEIVAAEAKKEAAKQDAEKVVIEAEAHRAAAEKEAIARKTIADAKAEEEAVIGMGEARALEAKAKATEEFGTAEANVIEKKGTAEADAMHKKYSADAQGITEKAEAMKLFHDAGKEHEEFKLELNKDLQVELAEISARKDIAAEQSRIVGEALKHARIDIVGGESQFFDKIVNSVTGGKAVDRYVDNSHVLSTINDTFFNGDADAFKQQLRRYADYFGVDSEDIKNLTVSALLAKIATETKDKGSLTVLSKLSEAAQNLGLGSKKASDLLK